MAQINLVTGYTGEAHIKSEEDALLNRFLSGMTDSVIDLEETHNSGGITVECGALVNGRLVKTDEAVTLPFTTPDSGKYRYDTVYLTYEKATSGIESANLVYCEGEASATKSTAQSGIGTPTEPSGATDWATLKLYTIEWSNSQTYTVKQEVVVGSNAEIFDGVCFKKGETGSLTAYGFGFTADSSHIAVQIPLPKILPSDRTFGILFINTMTVFWSDGTSTTYDSNGASITKSGQVIQATITASSSKTGLCVASITFDYVIS